MEISDFFFPHKLLLKEEMTKASLFNQSHLFFYSGGSKMEEACDMYVRAANMYKMAKNWCGKRFFSYRLE